MGFVPEMRAGGSVFRSAVAWAVVYEHGHVNANGHGQKYVNVYVYARRTTGYP
jgi:hypothetical protein